MANLSFLSRLSADVLTEQQAFYGYDAGWGFQILICLATFLIGFSLAGLFRSIIVDPPDMIWPGVLGVTALNKVLHSTSKEDITNGFVLVSVLDSHSKLTDCCRFQKDMEDLAVCLLRTGLLRLVCLVLVSGFYHDLFELLYFPLLDQSYRSSGQSGLWDDQRHGSVANNI